MKKIAMVTPFVALEGEKGYSRFRTLAEMLSQYYDVDLIVSSFQHWDKKQRDLTAVNTAKSYKIRFFKEPGYKKNIDLRRLISQYVGANNILTLLKTEKYDLIYCVIPGNRRAKLVSAYAKKKGIKVIIDVEDLWPEAMEMVSPLPQKINNLLFSKLRRDAKLAYQNADGIIGTSDEYRDIPKNKYGVDIANRKTVYVGYNHDEYFDGVKQYSSGIAKSDKEFWVTYAGTLGSSYDIATLIRAAQKIYADGIHNIQIKILGGGPLEQEFKQIAAAKKCNVEFVGYVPYGKMAAYLCKSDITINSFVKKAPQSIVTKIGDYLAAGKPMINTLSSHEFRSKVEQDGFGVNVEAENVDALRDAIVSLYENEDMRKSMGEAAHYIAEKEFDRRNAYMAIYDMICGLIGQ